MEYIVVIIICILSVLILSIIYEFKPSYIKKLKSLGFSEEMNEITNKLPENKEICEDILTMLDNEKNVKIVEDKNAKASLYIVATNTISIASVKKSCTRIQTIAHECIHSIQNKKILMFNFIYSNIYIIYFLAICILTLFNKVQNMMLQIFILSFFSFIYYKIRSFLEIDAMTRAPYVANEYMKKSSKLQENEIEEVMNTYKEINKIGIKAVNLELFAKCVLKIIIYAGICLI